jgi:Family of unknown function (DUF6314)
VEPDVLGRYHGKMSPTFRASGSPPQVTDALAFLRGTWQVTRQLIDHRAAADGTFTGVATWLAPDGPVADDSAADDSAEHGPGADEPAADRPVLAYHEHGELVYRGHRGPASRRLIYRSGPDGTADVRFTDGHEFYQLDARDGTWQAQHECGADHYAVSGRVLGDDAFREHWRVTGPAKDYEIITTLVRADQRDPDEDAGTA